MFYSFIAVLVKGLLLLLNGKTRVTGRENLPQDGNYILISPHKFWLDPVMLAVGALPKHFTFMAKKELFDHKFLGWFITKLNAFPVDRANPGTKALKIPIKRLKETDLSLIMFPSGSRHSDESKNGAALIARMAKVPIIPVIYQGPLTFKGILKRQKMSVHYGQPIQIESKEDVQGFAQAINQVFEDMEQAHQ